MQKNEDSERGGRTVGGGSLGFFLPFGRALVGPVNSSFEMQVSVLESPRVDECPGSISAAIGETLAEVLRDQSEYSPLRSTPSSRQRSKPLAEELRTTASPPRSPAPRLGFDPVCVNLAPKLLASSPFVRIPPPRSTPKAPPRNFSRPQARSVWQKPPYGPQPKPQNSIHSFSKTQFTFVKEGRAFHVQPKLTDLLPQV